MKNSKMPAFTSKTIKSLAPVFPYKEQPNCLGRAEYQQLAKAQHAEDARRRASFLERLEAYKKNNESVRSYPTPSFSLPKKPVIAWDEETQTNIEVLPVRLVRSEARVLDDNLASTEQIPNYERTEEPSSDEYPYDAPPLDPSQYASVAVDDEYDTTGPLAPEGSDGQVDVRDWSKATVGTVTCVGRFPYRFKDGEQKTFMVRVGSKDHWGVDLERVVREFKLQKGDKIALMCIGKQDVIVPIKEQQPDGSLKTVEKAAKRNTWVAKRLK